jgi:hypothetical protein
MRAFFSWHVRCTLKDMRAVTLFGLLVAFGCAGRAASVTGPVGASAGSTAAGGAGAGLVAVGRGAGASAGGASGDGSAGASGDGEGGEPCPFSCPAPNLAIAVQPPGGGMVPGAEATLTGPATVTLSCGPNGPKWTGCFSEPGPVIAGTYSLLVTAPGFESIDVTATVTTESDCGCTFAALEPPEVTLTPATGSAGEAGAPNAAQP